MMIPPQLEQPRRTNKLAIASLILGITTLSFYLVWPILAGAVCLYYRRWLFLETLSVLVTEAAVWSRDFNFYLLFYLPFLTGLSGFVTGIIATVQIKKGRRTKGDIRVAIAGVILAVLSIIPGVIFYAHLACLWFILALPM